MPDPSSSRAADGGDGEVLDALDRLVDAIQRGDEKSRGDVVDEFPELGDFVNCLQRLDAVLAPTLCLPQHSSEGVRAGASGLMADDVVGEAGGQAFGRYQLIEQIGRGGMGVVYKAQQTDLDRVVALKMINPSRLANQPDLARFYSEARAAARLRHPNIVGILEIGEVHGQHFFAMDLIEGMSLAEHLQMLSGDESSGFPVEDDSVTVLTTPLALLRRGEGRHVEPDTAARWVADVARAVDYLHHEGVVHRDLKPANILLDIDQRPLVTDFGLARVFGDEATATSVGTIVGTPGYMAPEQASGRSEDVSPRSDIFSLGVILYEMLTGHSPFAAASPLDTLVRVLESEPVAPSHLQRWLSRELDRICMKCLEKDPKNRYHTAGELADDLERYLRRENVVAGAGGFWQRLRRWGRRQPALVTRLSALGLAGSIVQASYLSATGLRDSAGHLRTMGVLVAWAFVSVVFQWLLQQPRITGLARYGWCAGDTVLMTVSLFLVDSSPGPLLVGYPLLVAASGLFFRVRLVWFMTFACLVAYASLLALRRWWHGDVSTDANWHFPVIFAVVLAVIGFVVAYQVYRVRVLSRYYRRGQSE